MQRICKKGHLDNGILKAEYVTKPFEHLKGALGDSHRTDQAPYREVGRGWFQTGVFVRKSEKEGIYRAKNAIFGYPLGPPR